MIDSGSTWKPGNEDLLETDFNVERGVTDSFFYYLRGKIYGREIEEEISRAVEEEMSIVSGQGEIRKILLVNKDEDFIRDVILSEPLAVEQYGVGFKKGNTELCKLVSDAMVKLADKAYEIAKVYGLEDSIKIVK